MGIPDYSKVKQAYMEISSGDQLIFDQQLLQYNQTKEFILNGSKAYGFNSKHANPEDLNTEEQEWLQSIWTKTEDPRFDKPTSLVLKKITINLSNLGHKAHANFVALCTGSQGVSKLNKKCMLHYKQVPFHRIISNYIAQSGDVTLYNGSGGDSVFKSQYFIDEPAAMTKHWQKGSVLYANSGKNKNSSQFFFILSDDLSKYNKIVGHHAEIGVIDQYDLDALDLLNKLGSENGEPSQPCWISDCGIY